MRTRINKLAVCVIFSAMLAFFNINISTYAGEAVPEFYSGYLPYEGDLPEYIEPVTNAAEISSIDSLENESYFCYSEESNELTSVKNQGRSNLCWDFSMTSAVESYIMRKHGKKVDFSEKQLAYARLTDLNDKKGYLNGSNNGRSVTIDNRKGNAWYFFGSNQYVATVGASSGMGFVSEDSGADLSFSEHINSTSELLNSESVPDSEHIMRSDYLLSNMNWISVGNGEEADISLAKSFLKANGPSVMDINATGYTYDYTYEPTRKRHFYFWQTSKTSSNHEVLLIGWNDDFPKEKFQKRDGSTPSENGAFILQNSWGEGYDYISYEDVSLTSRRCFLTAYEVEENKHTNRDNVYSNIYQYEKNYAANETNVSAEKGANSFNVKIASDNDTGHETLKAVNFWNVTSGTAKISIYLNSSEETPESGTLIENADVECIYPGYHTYRLKYPYELSENDRITVIVDDPGDKIATLYLTDKSHTIKDSDGNIVGILRQQYETEGNNTLKYSNGEWIQSGRYLPQIKADTDDGFIGSGEDLSFSDIRISPGTVTTFHVCDVLDSGNVSEARKNYLDNNKWGITSSDAAVAAVSSNGTISVNGTGIATISVKTSDNSEGSFKVFAIEDAEEREEITDPEETIAPAPVTFNNTENKGIITETVGPYTITYPESITFKGKRAKFETGDVIISENGAKTGYKKIKIACSKKTGKTTFKIIRPEAPSNLHGKEAKAALRLLKKYKFSVTITPYEVTDKDTVKVSVTKDGRIKRVTINKIRLKSNEFKGTSDSLTFSGRFQGTWSRSFSGI